MNALFILLAAATLGIDVGWERLPEGGMEYVIQLDGPELEALRAGAPIESDIPPGVGEIRSYRILLGKGKPRRDAPAGIDSRPTPPTIVVDPTVKQLSPQAAATSTAASPGRRTGFEESQAAISPETSADNLGKNSRAPDRPWLPLTFTALALFASIGANVFLGWIAWESRRQCRERLGVLLSSPKG